MVTLNYEVIASGSKGNAVLIEDVLVDIGIPFTRLRECLYDVKYILITHIHTDHLKLTTYNKIRKMFPNIVFIGNWEVGSRVNLDYIVNAGYPITIGNYQFEPFELVHDVLCYGFTWEVNGQRVIYATDTHTMIGAPAYKYDYLFLESNHDLTKIKMASKTGGYDPKLSALRHLSTYASKEFYFTHRKSPESVWVELHKSERFY